MQLASDRPLFTPGPLTTSRTVKQAMLRDVGSRDDEFLATVARVRRALLRVAHAPPADWTCVPIQGSGTYAIESVISSVVPRDGHLVVAINGAYGQRMRSIGLRHAIPTHPVEFPETEPIDPTRLRSTLEPLRGKRVLLACVHCETTTGLVNPIVEIASLAREYHAQCLIDSMSGFGALPLDLSSTPGATWLATSSNKCVEGVPGLALVLARSSALADCEGLARTLSLDLHAQWKGLESDGQFRFTPPTHVLLALEQALIELEHEGGPASRLQRYTQVQRTIVRGMRELGFRTLLPDHLLSPIITSFLYPTSTSFHFKSFADALADSGYVIYPGKVSSAPCFRIGSIGRLRTSDATGLLSAVRTYLERHPIPAA